MPYALAATDRDDPRLQLLRCALADPHWPCQETQRRQLRVLLDALASRGPGTLQEAQWLLLAETAERYLEARQQRRLQALLQG